MKYIMKLFPVKMPIDLIDLIKGTAALVGSRNVSQFIRGILRERCLEIHWDRRPREPRHHQENKSKTSSS